MKNAKGEFNNKSLKQISNRLKPWFSLIVIVLLSLIIYAAYLSDRGNTGSVKPRLLATPTSKQKSNLRLTPSPTKQAITLTSPSLEIVNPVIATQTIILSTTIAWTQPTQLPFSNPPLQTYHPNLTQTSTSIYISTLVDLLDRVTGEWHGIATTKVNQGERPKQPVKLSIQRGCSVGLVCGKYHFDSPCYGNLILKQLKGVTLIFKGQDLSGNPKCENGGLFYIRPMDDGDLSLGTVFIDSEGRITVQSTKLELVRW
jgi:hypothetical protein